MANDRRDLTKKVNTSVRQGRLMPAIVVDVFYDKATVRLGGSGTILRGLDVVGGPVEAGATVHVDFTTIKPTVVYKGSVGLTSSDLADALKKLREEGVASTTKISITLFSGGGVVDMFDPSEAGLTSALLSANNGDIVFVPDIDVEIDVTVPAGVGIVGISSRQSIIRGTVTIGADCSLETLAIIVAQRTDNEVNALISQGAGYPSWIRGCEIHAYNCGDGTANAVKIASDTDLLQIENCVIVADADTNSNAHAFDGAGGICKIVDSRVYSKSAENYNGTTFYIHNNITHVSEIDRRCVPIVVQDHLQLRQYPIPYKNGAMPRQAWSTINAYQFIDEATGDYSPGSHCKFDNYVYQDFTNGSGDRVIREVRITDGNTIDVTVWSGAPTSIVIYDRMIAVTGRELYVLQHDTSVSKIRVFKVNFETETSEIVFETSYIADEGDEITGIGYKYYREFYFVPVKRDNDDLVLAIIGMWVEYVGDDESFGSVNTGGAVFWIKNWTQGSGWVKHEGPKWYDEAIALDQFASAIYTQVVDGRYICCTSNLQFNNVGSTIAAMGAWSFDLDTEEVKQDIIVQVPKYSSFAPSPGRLMASQVDKCMYVLYNSGDYQVSGIGWGVIYKYDPVTGDFSEYLRASGTQSYNLLLANKSQVYLWRTDSGQNDFLELTGKTVVTSDFTVPSWSNYSLLLNDSNEMMGYDKTTGLIHLFNILTEVDTTVDVDLEADTASQSIYFFELNGCYLIYGEQYVGPGANFITMAWIIVDGS